MTDDELDRAANVMANTAQSIMRHRTGLNWVVVARRQLLDVQLIFELHGWRRMGTCDVIRDTQGKDLNRLGLEIASVFVRNMQNIFPDFNPYWLSDWESA